MPTQRASKGLGGLGIAIVSTNKGVLTDKKGKELNVGGEVSHSYGNREDNEPACEARIGH